MKRRDFIQFSASSMLLPLLLDGFGAKAYNKANTPFMKAMEEVAETNDRILVVIQLGGGNDGLNMVIPLDQYDTYSSATFRGNIAIPEGKILKLKKRNDIGLHPSMSGLQTLHNEGKLAIVHSAGYASPSFSHFRASDIWFTASDADKFTTSGWLGRYLENRYLGFPDDYPNNTNPDPLAIQIASISSTAFVSSSISAALAIQDPDTFARIVGDKPNLIPGDLPNNPAGKYTAYIRQQQTSSVAYAAQLKTAAAKGKNLVNYPASNSLADQLKIVSRMIAGGLQTKVYYVNLGGFDTHSDQVSATDNTTGNHANLLQDLSDGIKSFMDDLKANGLDNRVAGMTFSEFGRRAISNGSKGTDHGWASPLLVFGNGVKTQNIGTSPNLKDLVNNNIKLQTDFRQVYASILTDWMGASEVVVKKVLLNKSFANVPIFKEGLLANEEEIAETIKLYPNPAQYDTIIESDMFAKGIGQIQIADLTGRFQNTNASKISNTQIRLDISQLPMGEYLLNIDLGKSKVVKKLMVSR